MIQMDMFTPVIISELQAKIEKVDKSTSAVRRGLFARNTAIDKRMIELEDLVNAQQRQIDRLKAHVYVQDQPELELKIM